MIHSAAAVEFDNPADLSAQTNLLGAARMVEALKATGARPHLVHVSTAYVGGMLRGLVREEAPSRPGSQLAPRGGRAGEPARRRWRRNRGSPSC